MSQGESVVITGVGLVTCLGLTAQETWRGVLERRAGFGSMPALESPLQPGRTGAQAPDLPPDFFPGGPREARYLRWAIDAAIGATPASLRSLPRAERIGVVMGTTLHGMREGGAYLRTGDARAMERFLAGGTLHEALRGQ